MDSAANQRSLVCFRCQLPLEEQVVSFNYMSYSFTKEMPVCPKCGQVYIPKELVLGTMRRVEAELEDK